MKKTLFPLLGLCLTVCFGFAQKPLSNSRQSSYYTYIYKLKPEDILNFYEHAGSKLDEKTLQHPIDSFKTNNNSCWENTLPAGNYLSVYTEKNTLKYKLIENHTTWLKLMPNTKSLQFIFTDKEKLITPQKVLVNNRPVAYDTKTGYWHTKYSRKDTLIQAEYGGVINVFPVKQREYYRYNRYDNVFKITWNKIKNLFDTKNNSYRQQYNRDYTGFIVFNKPKYKPHDTVKFKAYIIKSSSKRPVKYSQLLVRLKDRDNDNGKIIGKVNSYRNGAYSYNFVLDDSLKLELDDDYTISLENPSAAKYDLDKNNGDDDDDKILAKRKVCITGKFHYEDYELKSIHFNMRTDKKEHKPGNPLAVYLKATDENDLPVPDGRVRLTLVTSQVQQYKNNKVFIPDTLWQHQLPLDPIGETKLVIPDSVFPKADLNYRIDADFLNSSNEHGSATEYVNYKADKFAINNKLNGDTLISSFLELGKDKKMQAIISALNNNDDTLSKLKVMLPYQMIINPNVSSYDIETDSAEEEFNLKQNEAGLSLSGYRTADSLFVNVKNERKLHFWYSVFAGNSLIDEGQADSLFYKRRYSGAGNITFLINYIWAGESKSTQTIVGYADKVLTINVKQPLSVYPGQQAETTVVVTDINGKPVPNTDITAWSFTKKFEDYTVPFVPYLGKTYPRRKTPLSFNILKPENDGSMILNWNKWGREIGLDSIEYYKFSHPGTIYRIEEPVDDTITQIAPFIVKNGDVVPVHILYIDNRPVYFSQAQQVQRYSFRVSPGLHALRFRTANQNITLDTVRAEKSKKLILSLNDDAEVNNMAKFKDLPDTLSIYEADLINKYMITMVDNFGYKMAEIDQNNQLILLNTSANTYNRYNTILTGPLADNYAIFKLRGEKDRLFNTEPGYSYLFEPGLLKQKSIATAYPFSRHLKILTGTDNYKQYALTQTEADTIWQQYLDLRCNTQVLFTNKPVNDKVSGPLDIGYINEFKKPHPFIKNIIIYRYDDPDYIRVYPGNTLNFGKLPPGKYRLFFLLKGDVYDIIDSVIIKPFGVNYYRIAVKAAYPKDSVSIKISNIIENRNGEYKSTDSEIENDGLRLKEAFNDKYFDNSSFGDTMSGTVVAAEDGLPIPGVTVKIKCTNNGTQTDVSGKFTLKVPHKGTLIFLFIGYQPLEVIINPGETINVKLKVSSQQLSEVVVVGYGVATKRDLTGSVSTVNAMAYGISVGTPGAPALITLRGNNSITGSGKPLIIVDGVPVENMDNINPSDIDDISILKEAAATALYGSKAANGVIIINTKKKNSTAQTDSSPQHNDELSLRKNFSDYAYWQPKLTTDENGKASFMTTFPDDITNWRTFIIGINGQKQSGYAEHQIKSYKPLSANLITPLFAVRGDELSAIGKVTIYNSEAIKLTRSFTYNGKLLKQGAIEVTNSKIDTLKVTVANTDSLTFEYSIKRDNGYFDGERRKIPVIEQGVEETKGTFEALNADTTVTMQFDQALGPVTFRVEASVLPALAEEAERLRGYKYLCNEQLASKLIGFLAEKRIRTYLGESFKYEKNIGEVIKKLQENRRSQGTWGWWKDTDEELWISLHAIGALIDAQKEGYSIDIDLPKLTEYLVYQLESYNGEDKLSCLQLLHKLNAKVDYPKYLEAIDKVFVTEKQVSRYDQFKLILLKQEAGLPVKLDSLYKNEHYTLFGNVYWGDDSYHFFDNSIQLSVLAYAIIKNEGKHTELLKKIWGYFLEQRRAGQWRNTYETSLY